jgi:hypothetical protein
MNGQEGCRARSKIEGKRAIPSTNLHWDCYIPLSILLFGYICRYERDGIMSDVRRWLGVGCTQGWHGFLSGTGHMQLALRNRSESWTAETRLSHPVEGFGHQPPYFHDTNVAVRVWSLHNLMIYKYSEGIDIKSLLHYAVPGTLIVFFQASGILEYQRQPSVSHALPRSSLRVTSPDPTGQSCACIGSCVPRARTPASSSVFHAVLICKSYIGEARDANKGYRIKH